MSDKDRGNRDTIRHDGYSPRLETNGYAPRSGQAGRFQDGYQPNYGTEQRRYQPNASQQAAPMSFPISSSVTSQSAGSASAPTSSAQTGNSNKKNN